MRDFSRGTVDWLFLEGAKFGRFQTAHISGFLSTARGVYTIHRITLRDVLENVASDVGIPAEIASGYLLLTITGSAGEQRANSP